MLTLDALRAYGADVDDGLRRCMNMEAFYLRLFSSLKGDTRVEELKAAGAEDFIHVRTNILESLTDYNKKILK